MPRYGRVRQVREPDPADELRRDCRLLPAEGLSASRARSPLAGDALDGDADQARGLALLQRLEVHGAVLVPLLTAREWAARLVGQHLDEQLPALLLAPAGVEPHPGAEDLRLP